MGDNNILISDLIARCSNSIIISVLVYHKTKHSCRCDCMRTKESDDLRFMLLRRFECVHTSPKVYAKMRTLLELSLKNEEFFAMKGKQGQKQEDVVNLLFIFVEVFRIHKNLQRDATNDILSIAGFKDKDSLFAALTSGTPVTTRIRLASQVAEKYINKDNN